MNWKWLAGAALFGVAALSVYWAFQSPTFVSGLAALAAGAAWKAIQPAITKRLPEDQEAAWREAEKSGQGDEWRRKRRGAPPKG